MQDERAVFQQAPGDQHRAVALAELLPARAAADADFGQALREWQERADPVRANFGATVPNTIRGDTQYGSVLQIQNFTDIVFGALTPPHPVSPIQHPGPSG